MRNARQGDWVSWAIIAAVFAAVAIALFATPARSETVLAERTMGQGGLICDTEKEVAEFIELSEKTTPQAALQAVDGCGLLQRPVIMKVTLIDEVQTEKARYLIVKYEFPDDPIPVQYGIGGRHLRGASL